MSGAYRTQWQMPPNVGGHVLGWRPDGKGMQNHPVPANGIGDMLAENNGSDFADIGQTRKNLGTPALVTSRTDAKALVPATDAAALILATSMEIGRFLWRSGDFSAMVAADTAEAVYLKAASVNANAGAWVRDFDFLLPEMFGDLDGTIAARTTAYKAAVTLAALLNAPLAIKGHRKISDKLTGTGNVSICPLGGPGSASITWDAASAAVGIELTQAAVGTSWKTCPSVRNLGLFTEKFNSGTMVKIIGGGTNGNPGMPGAVVEGNIIRGKDSGHPTTQGFDIGIHIVGAGNVRVNGNRITGCLTAPEPGYETEQGILYDGEIPGGGGSHATVFHCDDNVVYYAKVGIETRKTEGVLISKLQAVGVKTGWFGNYADVYPHHVIRDSHINASDRCIDILNGSDVWVTDNELYKQIGAGDGVGVYVRGASRVQHVEGNVITHVDGGGMNQIVIDNTARAPKISGNTFRRSSGVVTTTLAMWVTNSGVQDAVIEDDQVFDSTGIEPLLDSGTRTKKDRKPIVMQGAVAAVLTGTTAETTLATIVIPARTIRKNGSVRITSQFSASGAAGTRTIRNKFGGVTILEHAAASANVSGRTQSQIHNRNATNSQVANGIAQTNWASGGSAVVTSAVDTTADVTILITGQLANAGDTMTLESWMVEIFPSY